MKIPVYENIQAMDEILCWGRGFMSHAIRGVTAPRLRWKPEAVSIHTAIVVDVEGLYFLVEACGKDGGRVRINPMKKYCSDKNYFGTWLMMIKRYPEYNNPQTRIEANRRVIKTAWEWIKYDYSVAFQATLGTPDNPNAYYCSELSRQMRKPDGVNFGPYEDTFISPYNIQTGVFCYEVRDALK